MEYVEEDSGLEESQRERIVRLECFVHVSILTIHSCERLPMSLRHTQLSCS